jgi:lipopolysaccharide transport system permease protein
MSAMSPAQETVIEPGSRVARLGLTEVWEHRYLLKYFVLRALRTRYRPTRLGYLWVMLRPIMLCVVYVLVVGFLFKVETKPIPFSLFVFFGVSLFLFFAGGVSDTMSSLVSNSRIISKVYYPRLIVPLTTILANFIDLLAAMVIVGILMLYYGIALRWTAVFVPAFLFGFVMATFAFGLIGAARTVRYRDMLLMMPSLMRVAVYVMPCVYPVALIPEKYLSLYYLNPLAVFVQGLRWSAFGDVAPPAWSVWLASFVVVAALAIGLNYFNRVERAMVDTL